MISHEWGRPISEVMKWTVPDILLARAFLKDRSDQVDKAMEQGRRDSDKAPKRRGP